MTDDNQYVVLSYFYALKHIQHNRPVDCDGAYTDLRPQLNGITPQTARSWWTKHEYVVEVDGIFSITEKGEREFKAQDDYRNNEQNRKVLTDKKLGLEVTALEFAVDQFPTTRWQAKWGFIISVVMAALAAITIVVELSKDETTKVVVPLPIDTAQYRTFFEETKTHLQYDSLSLRKTQSYVDSLQTRIDSLESRAKGK